MKSGGQLWGTSFGGALKPYSRGRPPDNMICMSNLRCPSGRVEPPKEALAATAPSQVWAPSKPPPKEEGASKPPLEPPSLMAGAGWSQPLLVKPPAKPPLKPSSERPGKCGIEEGKGSWDALRLEACPFADAPPKPPLWLPGDALLAKPCQCPVMK